MDSVLNYPLYDAIVQAFTIPSSGNLSGLATVMGQIQLSFKVCLILVAVVMANATRYYRILQFSGTFWRIRMSPDGIVSLWTLRASSAVSYLSSTFLRSLM
jgi:hypothetical protein